MPLVSDDAIILQAFPYSETSKILRLLTRGHGVVSAMVRGARRPRNRYGGVLEPFTVGVATIYIKDSRDLQTMSGFDLAHSGQALANDLVRFGAASVLAELVLHATSPEPDPLLFERVRGSLRTLAREPPERLETAALCALWGVVAHLGFAPALDHCLACGRGVARDEDVLFDYAAGGIRCGACGGALHGRALPPDARARLAAVIAGDAEPLPRTTAHWDLLARFLSMHVLEGRGLRSLDFLARALAS